MAEKKLKETSVRLKDLRLLIVRAFENDVRRKAETMVLTEQGDSNSSAALLFAKQVSEAEPKAREQEAVRYGLLLQALKRGDGVARALAAFLGEDWDE